MLNVQFEKAEDVTIFCFFDCVKLWQESLRKHFIEAKSGKQSESIASCVTIMRVYIVADLLKKYITRYG